MLYGPRRNITSKEKPSKEEPAIIVFLHIEMFIEWSVLITPSSFVHLLVYFLSSLLDQLFWVRSGCILPGSLPKYWLAHIGAY